MASDIEILEEIKSVALECGRIAYAMRMNPAEVHAETKSDKSIVTAVDPLLENIIKERLVGKFGGSFLGEETGASIAESHEEYEWIVDPIDGTTNFDKGTKQGGYPDQSTWGISIGLRKNGQPHIGVIYKPQTDELFYAISGQGAYAETNKFGQKYTRKLELPKKFSDSRTILGIGIVGRDIMNTTNLEIYKGFREAVKNSTISSTSRSEGASGMEAVSVACGTYAAYISSVAEHDIAAARVILQEAGARVTTIENKPDGKYFQFIASHPAIHEALVENVRNAIKPAAKISGDLAATGNQQQLQQ